MPGAILESVEGVIHRAMRRPATASRPLARSPNAQRWRGPNFPPRCWTSTHLLTGDATLAARLGRPMTLIAAFGRIQLRSRLRPGYESPRGEPRPELCIHIPARARTDALAHV